MTWKPISSAPKDSSTVYVWREDWPYPVPAYREEFTGDWRPDCHLLRGGYDSDVFWSWRAGEPTHWKEIEKVTP